MKLFFQILAEFGLPVAAALIMGFFIYLIIKYILELASIILYYKMWQFSGI